MSKNPNKGRPRHPDILTPAEWRVVHLAQHGLTNQQMADNLQVSINAIKYHINNVVGKLQVIPNSGVTDKKSLLKYLGAPKDSAFHMRKNMNQHLNSPTIVNSIGQVSRTVKDIEKSEAWYRDILGLKHLYTYGKLAFFYIDGTRLFLSEAKDHQNEDKVESIIYFQTNHIKESYQLLIEKGVEFTHAPHKVHTHDDGKEEWMAFFNDLEGRPLGLMGQY